MSLNTEEAEFWCFKQWPQTAKQNGIFFVLELTHYCVTVVSYAAQQLFVFY